MTPLLLGTVTALSVRLLIPWVGPWLAEVDLDLSSDKPLPSGRVILTCGGEQLIGTVEPKGSGRFGEKAHVRVIAGGAAWQNHVDRQEFHNDAGLKSTDVLTATAGAVGETIVEAVPELWDVRYARAAGPASSVLDGLSWYVDAQGLTQVRDRATRTPTTDVEILDWSPEEKRAELAADTIVWPGTVLNDARIGQQTVREVEQVFSPTSGARVQAWMKIGDKPSTESTRYHAAMRRMIVRFAGVKHLRTYKYRIVLQGVDGRLSLQATDADSGIPDTLPVGYFSGMPGDTVDVTPGTECLVHFTEGDPRRAIVSGFAQTQPIERRIFATTKVRIGGPVTAPLAFSAPVLLALGDISVLSIAIAAMATAGAAYTTAFNTYATAIQPIVDPGNTLTGPVTGASTALGAAMTALATACATLQSQLAALIAPIPTVKLEGT